MKFYRNISKFYFVDFRVHSVDEIITRIGKLSRNDGIVMRKFDVCHQHNAVRILKLCMARQIVVFCHFQNRITKNLKKFTHGASSNKKANLEGNSMVIHSGKDVIKVKYYKPRVVFVSPVFGTKTHPEAKPLGKLQAVKIAMQVKGLLPNTLVYFLGGMNQERFWNVNKMDGIQIADGFAGIREV